MNTVAAHTILNTIIAMTGTELKMRSTENKKLLEPSKKKLVNLNKKRPGSQRKLKKLEEGKITIKKL